MIQLSPCIDVLYTDVPFMDRIRKVAEVGIKTFEFWAWYGKDIDAIRKATDKLGLTVATFGTYLGGNLVNASDHAKIPSNLRQAVEVAQKLDCRCLTVQTGNEIEGIPRQQHQSIVDGLKIAAEIAEPAGITLCLEPLTL